MDLTLKFLSSLKFPYESYLKLVASDFIYIDHRLQSCKTFLLVRFSNTRFKNRKNAESKFKILIME